MVGSTPVAKHVYATTDLEYVAEKIVSLPYACGSERYISLVEELIYDEVADLIVENQDRQLRTQ